MFFNKKRKTISIISALCLSSLIYAQTDYKPTFKIGVLVHAYAGMQQTGFGTAKESSHDTRSWNTDFTLHRARIITKASITPKDNIFLETELNSAIGKGKDKKSGIRVLDAQYEHKFSDYFAIDAGKMLVSHNRNGLQTASTLMVNNFTYYQYPYNISSKDILQNDVGRDIGVNLLGGFLKNKLKYRIGAFAGRRDYTAEDGSEITDDANKPLRYAGRIEYNFLDIDKYSGTNLGKGKTATLAAGIDNQGSYYAVGSDFYLDYPVTKTGSITLNTAYSYLTGGSSNSKFSFEELIPSQDIYLMELGYYFKKYKIQPWVRMERRDLCNIKTKGDDSDATVLGGGINYFFNGYKTNIRLSYVSMKQGSGSFYGQFWLQLQLYTF